MSRAGGGKEWARLFLNIIMTVLFGAIKFGGGVGTVYTAVSGVLLWAGLWGIFQKCGVKPWWALVPCVRYYHLGLCASREPEGRMLFIVYGVTVITDVIVTCCESFMSVGLVLLLATFELVLMVFILIYEIRIYLGLLEVYEAPKRWLFLAIFFNYIFVMILGWSKNRQPRWKVTDYRQQAAALSGVSAKVMDEGLTVNLEERTVPDLFKKKYLLRDIHMYIKPGSMVLLLGGSGAGKTTFLNAVNGYERAKAKVVLNSGDVYANYKKMQYEIGFVPQQDLMRGSDSVLRTLTDAAMLRLPVDMPAAKRRERVEEVMQIFGLGPVAGSLVVKLSGGQRKRLSIAMEFISNPSLFILDEPDSGLDGVMARELMQQLRAIADQGKIVIVITHTPDRVIDLFDDVIVLAKDASRTGRLSYYGSIGDARDFFGRESMEQIVRCINREEEGGEGRADEFIEKYAEVQHA